MKLVAHTIPKSDGSFVHDVYMTFKEKATLMSVWIATFRHASDCEEFIERNS